MDALRIVLLCIGAAVLYGIVHDQVTVRVCLEYFTIGHPPVFATESPTLLGLGWGVIATWWVGLLLGLPLAFVALRGPRPPRTAGFFFRPIASLLGIMAVAALVFGVLGYAGATRGWVHLVDPLRSAVPPDRHAAFLANLWAHSASYFVGFVGGIVLIRGVWRSRQSGD